MSGKLTTIMNYIKNFTFNSKKTTVVNKYCPTENRYVAYDYFKKQLQKALQEKNLNKVSQIVSILLNRFSVSISNSIKDMDEKNYVKDIIKFIGNDAVNEVKDYIKNNNTIAHAIEILNNITNEKDTLDYLDSILTAEDTLFDDKLVDKRIEILKFFEDKNHPGMIEKASIFLNDSDDRLVIASIRLIQDFDYNDEAGELVRSRVIDKIIDEETSSRIRIELLNIIISQNWKVSGYKKKLELLLPEEYYINSQGYLRVIENTSK